MKDFLLLTGMFLITLIIAVCAWVGSSYMEAKTYTELTGKNVSTYQAMWVDLRIVEPPRG